MLILFVKSIVSKYDQFLSHKLWTKSKILILVEILLMSSPIVEHSDATEKIRIATAMKTLKG